ncbi:hypothetical protein BU16DRAFT_605470 [Lophium mytilinum]|uniref:Uncharacterized protein n=1 Tax=Lophium mytilinum TaxID=390894 RepID=A0A6A6R2J3_9PEZI|nr:hypothetical protein BU16DRAFT_605470 [Lophium mytilinum]
MPAHSPIPTTPGPESAELATPSNSNSDMSDGLVRGQLAPLLHKLPGEVRNQLFVLLLKCPYPMDITFKSEKSFHYSMVRIWWSGGEDKHKLWRELHRYDEINCIRTLNTLTRFTDRKIAREAWTYFFANNGFIVSGAKGLGLWHQLAFLESIGAEGRAVITAINLHPISAAGESSMIYEGPHGRRVYEFYDAQREAEWQFQRLLVLLRECKQLRSLRLGLNTHYAFLGRLPEQKSLEGLFDRGEHLTPNSTMLGLLSLNNLPNLRILQVAFDSPPFSTDLMHKYFHPYPQLFPPLYTGFDGYILRNAMKRPEKIYAEVQRYLKEGFLEKIKVV